MWEFRSRSSSNCWGHKIILLSVWLAFSAAFAVEEEDLVASPCTSSEKWTFGATLDGAMPALFKEQFHKTITGSLIPTEAFGAAAKFRSVSSEAIANSFANYWSARALFKMELPGLASRWFSKVISDRNSSKAMKLDYVISSSRAF